MVATAERQGEKVIMQGNGFEGFCYETAEDEHEDDDYIDEPYDNDGDIAHCIHRMEFLVLCMVHSQMNSAALARQRPPQPRCRHAPHLRCRR